MRGFLFCFCLFFFVCVFCFVCFGFFFFVLCSCLLLFFVFLLFFCGGGVCFCISVCSAQWGMFHMERRSRNTIDIIIIITFALNVPRYSPYSITDIPCFELPTDTAKTKRNLLDCDASSSSVHRFPHQRKTSSKHHPQQRKVPQHKSQDSTSNDEGKAGASPEHHPPPPPSSSAQKSLALRRQMGLRSGSSSPETSSLTVTHSWPRHKNQTGSKKSEISASASKMVEQNVDAESDTNTSEDSVGVKTEKNTSSSLSTDNTVVCMAHGVGDASNPRIVIHGSGQNTKEAVSSSTSTEDSYCGFGISRTQRCDLIDHLKGFRNLTERQKSESPDGSRRGMSLSPCSADEACMTENSSCYLSQYSDPFDENSPVSPASLFAQKTFFQESDLEAFEGSNPGEGGEGKASPEGRRSAAGRDRLGSSSSYGRDLAVSPLQAKVAQAHACQVRAMVMIAIVIVMVTTMCECDGDDSDRDSHDDNV